MAKVFVSFASKDFSLADEVRRWLVEDGHDAFLDRDLDNGILAGDEWQQRLHERLRWADALVCVLTSSYTASLWCSAEVGIAQSRGSRVLPLRAEPGVSHPLLDSVQYVDMTEDAGAARTKLAAALLRLDAAGGAGWPDDRSPFPGLRPLDTAEHSVFFGRAREIDELATLLRSPAEQAAPAVLLVVGPSGCGKSSLVRAGLLPVMAAEAEWWTLPAILPGTQPVASLARELAASAKQVGLGWSVTDVRHRLDQRHVTELIDDLLMAVPGRRRRHLLLVVDQFEELLTQAGPHERTRFAEVLREALAGPVQVVATLRPEFIDPLLASPELAGLPARTHALRPLRPEALRAVIEGPADLAGIGVDADLVTRLVADTGGGDALPLLAYALAQLTDGITRGGQLSTARYEQLGGVQGALTGQADGALADAVATGARDRGRVIRELLRLVTVDEQGRPTRWRIHRDELPGQVRTELQPFIDRRLLTTDTERDPTTDRDRVVLGVAHEAFLFAWPPLQEAITADVAALRARSRVEQAAEEWATHGHSPTRLWERGQLAAALADTGAHLEPVRSRPATAVGGASAPGRRRPKWPGRRRTLVADRVELSSQARNFLLSSSRRDRSRRGRAIAILSTLLVLALAAAGFAFVQQRTAKAQARIAIARQFAATAEAELGRHLDQSMLLAVKGYRLNPEPRTYSAAFKAATASPKLAAFAYTDSAISALAAVGDGESVLVGEEDGTVASWNTRTKEWLRYGHLPHSIVSLAADGNRDTVVATDGYQVALLHPGSAPATLTTHNEKDLTAVAISSTADTVIYASALYGQSGGTITEQDVNAGTHSSVSVATLALDQLVMESPNVLGFDGGTGYWARFSLPDLHVVNSLHPSFGTHDYAYAMSGDGASFSYTNGAASIPVWDTATSRDGPNQTAWNANPTRWGRAPGVAPDAMALSQHGRYLAMSDAGTVYVSEPNADPGATPIRWQLTGVSNAGVDNLQFLGDDFLISSGQRQLAMWDFDQISPIATFQWAYVPSSCVACSGTLPLPSPDGRRVAYLAGSGVLVHDFSSGQDGWYSNPAGSTGLPSWSPDGRYLLVPVNGSVDVVASDSLTRIRTWPSDGLTEDVFTARYLDGNARFVTATPSGHVTIRNADTGQVLKVTPALPKQFQAQTYESRSVAINEVGTRLTLIGESGVHTFDLESGTATRLADASAYGISVQYAGGRLILTASSHEARTGWMNIYSGADGTTLLRHIDTGFGILEGGVGSEGRLVAYQARDGSVALIDSSDGTLVGTIPLRASVEAVKTGLAFDKTGNRLVTVTAGEDTDSSFIETWSVAPEALMHTLCRVAGRGLTQQEWQSLAGDERPDLTCH
jgi:WD40 repeat protein